MRRLTPVDRRALELGVYRLQFTVPADIAGGQHTLRTVCPSIEDGSEYNHPQVGVSR
jgi:hypothetical protein